MASQKKLKKQKAQVRRSLKRSRARRDSGVRALASAAIALQSIGTSPSAVQAQTRPEDATLRFQYVDYLDWQDDGDRMRVRGPMASLQLPLAEAGLLEGAYLLDSVSGASPLYLDSLSGASAKGINDTRQAGDLKYTHFFDRFSLSAGAAVSDEEDYTSYTGSVESRYWTADKNTTFTLGFAAGDDDISATNNRALDESRQNIEAVFGVTQVINPNSLLQINLTYGHGDGYFSDPYKPLDNRPRSRDRMAVLARHVLFLPSTEGSLHTDYRYAVDSWGLDSHLAELAWYQPISERWAFRPSIRYYTQSAADFFRPYFPPDESDGFYSADQRLAAFGGITFGIRGYVDIGWDVTLTASYEYLMQREQYRLLGSGTEEIQPFFARFFTVGFSKKFRTG